MIFISDSANTNGLSWLQDLDRDSRHTGGNTDFKKTLAAEALPTTQITIEVGNSSEQQNTRNTLMAQGSDKVAGAATMLANAKKVFADQISAQQAAQDESSIKSNNLGNYTMLTGEITYQNEKGEWVTDQLSTEDTLADYEGGLVQAPDYKAMLLSVLNSLVFGIPLSEETKQYINGPDSFAGLLEIPSEELEYAKNNSDYVLDTPLGKMTYQDLENLSNRVYNYVQNPTLLTRNLALEVMQDIAERQDELEHQYAQQKPFEEIQEQQRLAAAESKTEDSPDQQEAQEQLDTQVRAKVEHLEEQQDIQAQVRKLHAADHEADQDFLNTLKFSYDLLRS